MKFVFFLRFFQLFDKYGGYKTGKLKLKKPKQLQVSLTQSQAMLNDARLWSTFFSKHFTLCTLVPFICIAVVKVALQGNGRMRFSDFLKDTDPFKRRWR